MPGNDYYDWTRYIVFEFESLIYNKQTSLFVDTHSVGNAVTTFQLAKIIDQMVYESVQFLFNS